MTVELRVSVEAGPGVAVGMERGAGLSASIPAPTMLAAQAGGDVRIGAEVGGGAVLSVTSDSVNVPVVNDYDGLVHKPTIEGVEVSGDKYLSDYGMTAGDNLGFDHGLITVDEMTAAQIAALLTDD